MITKKDYLFLRKIREHWNIDRYSGGYNDETIRKFVCRNTESEYRFPAFYYSRNKEAFFRNQWGIDYHPDAGFEVFHSEFCHYEDYTPYHFAGLATKLFASKPQGLDDFSNYLGLSNDKRIIREIEDFPKDWDDVSYISESWKLGKIVNAELDLAFASDVKEAIEAINLKLLRLHKDVSISDLFAVDPIGWTIPVKLVKKRSENENNLKPIGKDDPYGCYNCEGIISNSTEWRPYFFPLETHSYIVLYIDEINTLVQSLNASAGNFPIERSRVIAYVLAHELFHAWQDFHVGLLHFDNWLKGNPNSTLNDEAETLAEYFALNFLWFVLKDGYVAKARRDFREKEADDAQRQGRKPSAYAQAVRVYGDVFEKYLPDKNPQQKQPLDRFLEALSQWEDSVIKNCY